MTGQMPGQINKMGAAIIDFHAYIYGRNWRVKNMYKERPENFFDPGNDKDLWQNWNCGCNEVGMSNYLIEKQLRLF
jgi:hypothetical protein